MSTPPKKASGQAPKKSYGQHFLLDASVLDRIASLALAPATSGHRPTHLVEIGPGTGNLTAALVEHPHTVPIVALEADRDLLPALRKRFAGSDVEFRQARAETFDYASLVESDTRWTAVGNLPYYAGAPIYFHLLQCRDVIGRAVLMFQAEVAERIAASAGSRAYGIPSVLTSLYGVARVALHVPPEAFQPPPKVDSAVVVVEAAPGLRLDVCDDEAGFIQFVKQAFGSRRKTLSNALAKKGDWSRDRVSAGLERLDVSTRSRAEELSPVQLAELFRGLRR